MPGRSCGTWRITCSTCCGTRSGRFSGLLSGMLFVCVFVIFLLAGRNPYAEHSQMYLDVVRKIRRYLGTKVIISAAVGVLVWASLAIIGMELAGVFGVLAFLLNFIPVDRPDHRDGIADSSGHGAVPVACARDSGGGRSGDHSQRDRKHHRAEADGRRVGSASGDRSAGLVVLGPSLGHRGDVPGGPDHGRRSASS